ncbi:hypothetical protein [Nostoc sp.]|uniref:hypothetical protein n=1 Tax=Nostoc sp. TaxID=1180 RepID=UPI003FA594D8
MQSSLPKEQEFITIDMRNRIVLKPKKLFPETKLDDVAGYLKYQRKPKTLEDIDNAIRQGIEES